MLLLLPLACGRAIKVDEHIEQSIGFAREGNIEQAILELKKAIELDPGCGRAYLGLGAFYTCAGLLEEATEALNRGIKLNPDYQLTLDTAISSILRRYHFSEEEITSKLYDTDDIKYVWRCLKYKETCANILNGCQSEEEKILALFDWTYRNTGIVIPREDYAALPLDIMLRGYGSCDRSAWVLATLANQAGYRVNIFYLRDPDEVSRTPHTTLSPHTVATIFLDGKWAVFDTYTGVYFRNPGRAIPQFQAGANRSGSIHRTRNREADRESLVGLNDIVDDPSITHHIPRYKEKWSKCFEKGFIWIPVEAQAPLPRMELMQNVLNGFLHDPPKVYRNPVEELFFTVKSLQGSIPSNSRGLPFKTQKGYLVDVWFHPFNLRLRYADGRFNEDVKRHNPALEYYRDAREAFLSGDYSRASEDFERLLKSSPNSDYSDDIAYFKCLCFFELGDWPKAVSELKLYLEKYPEGKWRAGAVYHLGRSHEELD